MSAPGAGSPAPSAAGQGVAYAAGNIISRLGGFLLLPLYLKMLTPAEYGILEMFYTASALLAMFVSAGLSTAVIRFYFEFDEPAARRVVVTTGLAAALGLAGGCAAALWFFAAPASQFLVGTPEHAGSFRLVLLILVVQMVSEVGMSFLRVENHAWKFVAASLGQLVLQVAVNIYTVVVLEWGVPGVLLGNLVGAGASGLVVVGFALARCPWRFNFPVLGQMLRYTWPMVAAAIPAVLLERADRFILEHFLGLEAVGIYALAEKLSMILSVAFQQPFTMSYGVYRFSIMNHPERSLLQRQAYRHYLVAVCFLGCLLIAFTPSVLEVIAQPAYAGAALLVPILVARTWLGGSEYVFSTGLLYAKATTYTLFIHVMKGVIRVLLTLALVGAIGLGAPAYASAAAQLVATWVTLRVSQRFDPVDWDAAHVLRVSVVVALCLLPAYWSAGHWGAAVAAVLLFPAASLVLGAVTREEARTGLRRVMAQARALRARLGR